jgi:hypothetical protein
MKIESLLRRPGGTKVTLDGVDYHFKPGPDGREYADVTNNDHIGIFASIREGYRIAGVEADAPKAAKPVASESPAPASDNLDKLDRPALAELFAKRFGHHPAPRLSPAKIIEALRDE